jgi:L-ascorbate metabolism protein UlaG (beta-lactamase superfamily)
MPGTDLVPERFDDWMSQYPQGEQLNYVFDPDGGRRIYMAGSYPDPSVIAEANRANAYMTLLQVLPGDTVCGMEAQIAALARASGCEIVVPQHHDPLFKGSQKTNLTQLKRVLAETSDTTFMEVVPGEW